MRLLMSLKARAAKHRPVSWLELFFDVIFVAAVAQIGEPLTHEFTREGLLRYAFLFLLIWWAWLGHTMFSTCYRSDDVVQRLLTFVQVFAVAVMAANAKQSLSTRETAGFCAAYAGVRIVLSFQYLRARWLSPSSRFVTIHAGGYATAAILWLLSALAGTPMRFYLWGLALVLEVVTPMFSARVTHTSPPDSNHIPERHGLFTLILIGESVTSVMRGIENQESWSLLAASSAILGLGVIFVLWWWYFEQAADAEERRISNPRDGALFYAWTYAHLPLCLGIAAIGNGIEHVVSLIPMENTEHGSLQILLGATSVAMIFLVLVAMTANERAWRRRKTYIAPLIVSTVPLVGMNFISNLRATALFAGIVSICVLGMVLTSWARIETNDLRAYEKSVELGTATVEATNDL